MFHQVRISSNELLVTEPSQSSGEPSQNRVGKVELRRVLEILQEDLNEINLVVPNSYPNVEPYQ